MQIPVQVVFRNMERSAAVEERVRREVEKLEQHFQPIMGCRVALKASHKHHQEGNLFHVRIDLTVPGAELVVSRDPSEHQAHEDMYVAIRDAFDAATRQVEEYAQKRRREVKHHETPLHGRVKEIISEADRGVIETHDGREILFTRNSVVDYAFNKLNVGDEVRFSEAEGEQGPVASTVHVVGKRHVAG